jgi:hypothetical protein
VRPVSDAGSAWKEFDAAGEVRVGELSSGGVRLREVQAQGTWRGGALEFTRLRFKAFGGRFDGRLAADYRAAPPEYRLAGNVKQMDVAALAADNQTMAGAASGTVSAELALQSAGTEPEALRRRLQGRVIGGVDHGALARFNLLELLAAAVGEPPLDDLAPAASTPMQSLAGDFRVGDEEVEFDPARLVIGVAALELSGRVGFDGRLELRLTGVPLRVEGREPSPRLVRLLSTPYLLTGTLTAPAVQPVEPVPPATSAAR